MKCAFHEHGVLWTIHWWVFITTSFKHLDTPWTALSKMPNALIQSFSHSKFTDAGVRQDDQIEETVNLNYRRQFDDETW